MLMLERSVTSPGYSGPARQATYGRREWSVDVGLLMLTEGEGKAPAESGEAWVEPDPRRRPEGRGQEDEGARSALGVGTAACESDTGATPGSRTLHTSGSDSRGYADSHSDNSNSGDATSAASLEFKGRKTREFTPDSRKDQTYWEKRRKNNEAARRSREKRRIHDIALESRLSHMDGENRALRRELAAIKQHFGLPMDEPFVRGEDDAPAPVPVFTTSPGGAGPPPSHSSPSQMGKTQTPLSSGLPPAAVHSAPPPLLTVASAMPVGVPVPSVHHVGNNGNGAPLPYYLSMAGEGGDHGVAHYPPGGPHSHPMATSCLQPHSHYHPGVYSSAHIKSEPPDDEGPPTKRVMYESMSREPGPAHLPDPHPRPPPLSLYAKGRPIPAAHLPPAPDALAEGWSASPSNSCTDEDTGDEPLQLTVRRDRDTAPSYPHEPKSPGYASLPVKLRHKMPIDFASTMSPSPPYPHPFVNGLSQMSENSLSQSSPLPLLKKENMSLSDYHDFDRDDLSLSSGGAGGGGMGGSQKSVLKGGKDPKVLDPKYIERRKRNNEAARKCRENRKTLTRMREAKSDFLEKENMKLRNEMESLQDEMKQLRDMLEKKRVEQGLPAQGGEGMAG